MRRLIVILSFLTLAACGQEDSSTGSGDYFDPDTSDAAKCQTYEIGTWDLFETGPVNAKVVFQRCGKTQQGNVVVRVQSVYDDRFDYLELYPWQGLPAGVNGGF